MQARELQEEVVTRDIWLPGFLLLRCARVCAIKRACGPFKSRHGLSIKKKKRKPDNGCQDVHALYFHNSVS